MEDYDVASDHSFDEEACYSDQIDSDIEAELYGLIHHDAQDNSISLQEKSNSIENESGCTENDSALFENSLDLTIDNTAPLLSNSVPSTTTVNSTKKSLKEKKSLKNNKQKQNLLLKTGNDNLFSSDAVVKNNLYFSFESPVRKQKTLNNQVRRENLEKNLINNLAKRKSEVVSNILVNIQQKNMKSKQSEYSPSKKKKNNQDHDSELNEDISFVEVIDDSSDSDGSIMVLEPDNSNIQTNISKETVVLSSDADDSDSSMEKSFSKACQSKQTAIAKLNFSPGDKDPWQINSEDKFRTKKQSNRYHESAIVTCSNCHLKGHNAKFCSVPKAMKCFFCGDLHAGMNCKNKICTKCFHQGHDRRRCYINRYIYTCDLCRMRGHTEKNCPDIWRRYHLTTSKGTIVKGNPNTRSPLYCYNCGSKGHYGAECVEYRTDRWNFPTWTSVVSYKKPINLLQRREEDRSFQEKSNFNRTPPFHRRIANETLSKVSSTPAQNKKKKKKKKTPKTPPNANYQPAVNTHSTTRNEVYFPRTPKISPNISNKSLSKSALRKLKKKDKEGYLLKQQTRFRIGLHQRLGLSFPSTI